MNRFFVLNSKFNFGNRLQIVFLVLGVLCITFGSTALAQPIGPQMTQQVPQRTITVSGKGVEMIPTTLTEVRLGVEVQGKTAQEVQQQVAQRSSDVVTLLRSRNVEKLQTTGITLNPIYSYNNNIQRLTGYSATNTVSFRIDTSKVGTLLDDVVKAGATRIDGVSFVAADPAIAAAQQQALREAAQDAQQQANAVLSALNFTAKEVVTIQVNNANNPPQPLIQYGRDALAEAKVASTPVVGGEQQVEASVTLQISY